MPRPLLHVLILVLATALVYGNCLENGFHLDDAYRVQNNPGVEEFWPPWRHFTDPTTSSMLKRIVQYRPLLPLSLSINYAISGHSVVGYHIGNILLQILASMALYFLARELFTHWAKLKQPALAALAVAGLFAVHPVSGIVVNYICSRDLAMMQMFLLASLWVYVRMRRRGESIGGWALCAGLLLLSLLAKKNAVAAPALIALFELLLARESIWRAAFWRRFGTFVALVGGFLLFIRFGLRFDDLSNVVAEDSNPVQYAAAQLQHHVFHYLRNFVWPFPIRQAPTESVVFWKQVVGLLVIGTAFVAAWRVRRSQPLWACSIYSYAALLALTSSFLVFHAQIVAYRPYPASAFLYLLLVSLAWRAGRIGQGGVLAFFLYVGVASVMMNGHWRDAESANRHSLAYGGGSLAFMQLGASLPPGPEKIAMFQRAVANQDDAMAILGLAQAEVEWGNLQNDVPLTNQGLARMGKVLSVLADNAQVRTLAAKILFSVRHRGDFLQRAADMAVKAVEIEPRNDNYRVLAGMYVVEAQRFQQGLQLLQPLLERRPDFGITRLCAGIAWMELKQYRKAEPLLARFAADNPSHFFAWRHLGVTRMGLQDWSGALQALRTAAAGNPNIPGIQDLVRQCQQRGGR